MSEHSREPEGTGLRDIRAEGEDDLGLRPLTARSVILSTLLGTHPPELPVRALVRIGGIFEIADGTVRVALSRMVAEGDVSTDGGRYRLTERLVGRQRLQDEAREPAMRTWRGEWEWAILEPTTSNTLIDTPPPEAFTGEARQLRMAAVRDGVWGRPANLARRWPAAFAAACTRVDGRPAGDQATLAARLWDLPGWAARAKLLLGALDSAEEPARRFVIGAAILRHLRLDPILPPGLLPADWPGAPLRRGYRSFERDFSRLLRRTGTETKVPAATGDN